MKSDNLFMEFPDQTFKFLKDLAANNHKIWFEKHKSDYQLFLLDDTLIKGFGMLAPLYHHLLEIKDN